MASTCGICQKKTIAKRIHASRESVPRAAAHPMTGGSAPGTAPMTVASDVMRFSGV
jgi:hypothetical protein